MNFALRCALLAALSVSTPFAADSTADSAADRAAPIPSSSHSTAKPSGQDWPVYGGTAENSHFSPLRQINRKNVKRLKVAWSFDTEESGGLQTSPIVVEGVLYGLTPSQKVFALNAATGKLLWKF